MIIFHHNDADGYCSAAIVKKFFGEGLGDKLKMITMDYHREFPLDEVTEDEEVWIVDFSIPVDDMIALREKTENVFWIDHHMTAIEKYAEYEVELVSKGEAIFGIRMDGLAGCELTWLFCKARVNYLLHQTVEEKGYYSLESVHKLTPLPVQYIGDRDVWRFHHGDDTRNFCMGLGTKDIRPTNEELWNELLGPYTVTNIIETGKVLTKYRDQRSASYIRMWGCEVEFEGHIAYAVNMGSTGSELFLEKNQEYPFVIAYAYNMKKAIWKITMYSGDSKAAVNVGEIAKKYGGGGHHGAAGFHCAELPFKRAKQEEK